MTAHITARRALAAATWAPVLALALALQWAMPAHAQTVAPAAASAGNAIESISANQQGANVIVKFALKNAPD